MRYGWNNGGILGILSVLIILGGNFEDRYFGFEDGGRFEHCSYFGFEGAEGFDWYCEDDVVLDTTWWRDGDWG